MTLPRLLSSALPSAPFQRATWCLSCLLTSAVLAGPAIATAAPSPTPSATQTEAAAWPGVVRLEVDATDLAHRVLQARERLPLPGGPARTLTLHYPRYLPGSHGPYGDVSKLAGLSFQAQGQRLTWRRDLADPFLFEVDLPAGTTELQIDLQFLTMIRKGAERVTFNRSQLGLEWESVLLYPAGQRADRIRFQPRLKLPAGWQAVAALRGPDGKPATAAAADGWLSFGEVSLETLIDSPAYAGAHVQRVELDPPGTPAPISLTLLADDPAKLRATPAQLEAHRALVRQADKLFGARHFRHYDFMLALSDELGGLGLEHHESSENVTEAAYFTDWDRAIRARELLPHEFVHSWNGKFRRPADLWTPDYQQPMRNSLLWVYEGMTEYWGHVLAARSGLTTLEQAQDRLASMAAEMQARHGRAWRNLQDTTNQAQLGALHDSEWQDWQRGSDYYVEGLLIWLDADTLIREESKGRRSLDDFVRAFHGRAHGSNPDGSIQPLTYGFNEVVETLASVWPHDWAGFLRQRLDRNGPDATAPLDGLARSGWRLAWTPQESRFAQNERGSSGPDGTERPQDLLYSLGLSVASDGKLEQVLWGSPAFGAGLAPGYQLLAVNDRAYKADRLSAAVAGNLGGEQPIRLLLRDNDHFFSVTLDWRGGLRHPSLERITGTPDRLADIYKPR